MVSIWITRLIDVESGRRMKDWLEQGKRMEEECV